MLRAYGDGPCCRRDRVLRVSLPTVIAMLFRMVLTLEAAPASITLAPPHPLGLL